MESDAEAQPIRAAPCTAYKKPPAGPQRHCRTPMHILRRIATFYLEGFRQMTWGRQLWLIILIKLFVLFAVLRLFFFRPVAPTIAL